jgi:hypothetical protein
LTIYRTVEGEPTGPPPDDDVIDVEPEEISTPEIEAVEDPVVAEWERLKQLDKLRPLPRPAAAPTRQSRARRRLTTLAARDSPDP